MPFHVQNVAIVTTFSPVSRQYSLTAGLNFRLLPPTNVVFLKGFWHMWHVVILGRAIMRTVPFGVIALHLARGLRKDC